MFDWDKDQESLVAITTKATPAETGADRSGLRSKLGLAALGLLIAFGFAYEKNLLTPLRGGSVFGVSMFETGAPSAARDVLPDTLLVYDAPRARRYLQGLRLADTATLNAYAARIRADLAQTAPALVPYVQDAETLVLSELARRSR